MGPTDIAAVAGVPETLLSDALLARLPRDVPPAPWTLHCRAVVWFDRGGPAATAALPGPLRDAGARAAVVVGGLVSYDDTPVGPYDEVFGLVGARTGVRTAGTVCFMSVDSEASLVGGRANWGMPKTLGRFEGEVAGGQWVTADGADVTRWRVRARPRPLGPSVPVFSRARCRQVLPDGSPGTSRLAARGRARLARVDVEVDSEGTLPTWLRPGRRLGAVVESATFSLGPPER